VTVGALLVRHDVASAGFVRRQLACDLAYHQLPAAFIDDAVLVANELVGNAVRHTSPSESGTLDVRWDVDGSGVRIWVTDAGAGSPCPRIATEDDIGGRGLRIVDAMSDDWGVEQGGSGKRVWAHVPVPRHCE